MKQFFGSKSRNALVLVLGGSLALHIVAVLIFGTVKFVSAVLREEQTFEAPPIEPPPQGDVSLAHVRETANRVVWSLDVPAGGEAALDYRVRVTRP